MRQLLRKTAMLILTAVAVTVFAGHAHAESGTVRLNITKVGFIIGVGGGSGELTFRGRRYPLSLGGLSAGTIGVSGAELVGRASNLRTAADIAGTYTAVAASVALAGGVKATTLRNANGVVLQLQGRQVGLEASLSLSGLTIAMR